MLFARIARKLWLAPLFPRALSVTAIALGLTAGTANAQLFGKNGPSIPAPKIPLPSPPKIELPRPPRIDIPRPHIDLPKPPPIHVPPVHVPDVKLPPVKLPPVHVPDVKIPPVHVPDVKLPPVKVPDLRIPTIKLPTPTPTVITDPDVSIPSKPKPPSGPKPTPTPPTKPTPGPNPTPNPTPNPGPANKPNGNTIIIVVPGGLPKPPVQPMVPVTPVQPAVPTVPTVPTTPVEPTTPTVIPATGEAQPVANTAPNALRVTERVLGGPGAKAGIQLGYIIIKVGDTRVKNAADLKAVLAAGKGKLTVLCFNTEDNKLETCEVTPEGGSMGIEVSEISVAIDEEPAATEAPMQQEQPAPSGETAVQITEVSARGIASRAGLQVGDVIFAVNGKRVNTPEQFAALLKAAGDEAEVLFVNPEDGKAEKRTLKTAGGDIGAKVRTVAVASDK